MDRINITYKLFCLKFFLAQCINSFKVTYRKNQYVSQIYVQISIHMQYLYVNYDLSTNLNPSVSKYQ